MSEKLHGVTLILDLVAAYHVGLLIQQPSHTGVFMREFICGGRCIIDDNL